MAFYFPPLSGVVAETTAGTIRQFCVQWLLINGNSSCCERICYVAVMLCSQIIRIMEAINVCRVKIYYAVNQFDPVKHAETYIISARMRNISNRPLLLLCLQCTEGHLYSRRRTPCVGPCRFSVILLYLNSLWDGHLTKMDSSRRSRWCPSQRAPLHPHYLEDSWS